jgi:glycine dehydrogenase subunit 1
MTTDTDGKRAYVMTLQAREQHIRREKAASNICTNQTLLALAASLWLAALGPHGLHDVAALGAAKAAELESALAEIGVARVHPGAYLNEFAVRIPNAGAVHRELLARGVLAGLVLGEAVPDEPAMADSLLVCATEITTSDEIVLFARELAGILATSPASGTLVAAPA